MITKTEEIRFNKAGFKKIQPINLNNASENISNVKGHQITGPAPAATKQLKPKIFDVECP